MLYIRLNNDWTNLDVTLDDIADFNIINMRKEPEVWCENTSLKAVFYVESGLLHKLYNTLHLGHYSTKDLLYSILYMKNT